ncbi:MAG: rhomboid family intramembrane serine protease [Candidatus Portnoybacteria bacterium]|nr:rhomboid family intramembrane serine protease [Candidatus Portnoybacteria bacterium]
MFPLHDSITATKTPLFTWGIIAANIGIFLLELSRGETFIAKYALIPSRVDFLQLSSFTPFISSMFLHGGWFHLLSNMWFLKIFGDNVEARFGKLKFFLFYLFAGVIAALVQFIAAPSSQIPMIGASGAIAGVLGAYFVFFRHAKITSIVPLFFYITVIDIPAAFYLPYWFLLQVFSGVGQVVSGSLATTGGIAFLAHAGGFVAGYAVAKYAKR